ncbi:hypothetical protein FN846DRAFT_904746 [Sphaerosporella brunnea]|uniref:PCI domain-containing protein n=1 Tax=Sphaerosporella brunnea TaxID=1250544 RepID=A0A5J5F3M7_9PEZI|nr:hypothetical protein FN846DRAFT_904746 [Sphaerosporella brunnea]
MSIFYSSLRSYLTHLDGRALGSLLNPTNPDNHSFAYSSNHYSIRKTVEKELSGISSFRNGITDRGQRAWVDVVVSFWEVVCELERGNTGRAVVDDGSGLELGYWGRAYTKMSAYTTTVSRGFINSGWQNWLLPVLYEACRNLRDFAIRADEEEKSVGKSADKLEDAARHLNKMFTLCLSDRAPLEESRKWGTYYIVGLLFKTYFKLNAITLCKNVVRALGATTTDMPPLDTFPKSHQVTFHYYVGVIHFLEEDYVNAEMHLNAALQLCQSGSYKNQELILTYLIPAHLMTTHQLPTNTLFTNYPRLKHLFQSICSTIKTGNLQAFDQALEENEDEYVRRRIYLTLERGRDIALRNLFRRVFVINGKKTRIPVDDFRRAMGFAIAGKNGGTRKEVEPEEIECLLAGMIYKGLMRGYISREKSMVVLSNKEAFPGTGV